MHKNNSCGLQDLSSKVIEEKRQPDFDDWLATRPQLAGADYDHDRDGPRLLGQIKRVFDFMRDGAWHTLADIAAATGDPPASVSAQLRHIRNKVGFPVEKHYIGNGLYEYKMGIPVPDGKPPFSPIFAPSEKKG